jgi:hypothetical protein
MGWKTINGRRYFYKSERVGGRVKTTSYGGGESDRLISLMDAGDREDREAERKQRRAERDESASEEKAIGDSFGRIQADANTSMIAARLQKHRGHRRVKRK